MHDTVKQILGYLHVALGFIFAVLGRITLLVVGTMVMLIWIGIVMILTGRPPSALRRYL